MLVDMTTTGERTVLRTVWQRWPSALALVIGGLMILGGPADETTHNLTEVLLQLPVIYLVIAAARQPRWSWAIFGVLFVVYAVLRMQEFVEPTIVFLAVALAAIIWGAGHRAPHLGLQIVGMVLFGGIALAAFAVHPDLARYLLAAGWFGHAAWDAYHLYRDRVVHRTYAELCGVLDLVVVTGLLLM